MQMACWRWCNSELPHSKNEKEDACDGKESGILSLVGQKVWNHFYQRTKKKQSMKNRKCERREQRGEGGPERLANVDTRVVNCI